MLKNILNPRLPYVFLQASKDRQYSLRTLCTSSSTHNLFKLKTCTAETGVKSRNIKSILECPPKPDSIVRVHGWVKVLRKQKSYVFVEIEDGSTWERLHITMKAKEAPPDLNMHSSVDITGKFLPKPKDPTVFEIHPTYPVTVVGPCNQQQFPFGGRTEYDDEQLRHHPHLRFKTSRFSSLIRLRSSTFKAICDFFNKNDFTQIHTPVLTGNDCEGAGEIFVAKPFSNNLIQQMRGSISSQIKETDEVFFNRRAFLTVSSQLHLEAAAGGLERVWTMSPVFRADNQQSSRHLSEFYMIEAEQAFAYTIEDILKTIEDLVKECIQTVVFGKTSEWDYCCKDNSRGLKNMLENVLKSEFTVMTFQNAKILLEDRKQSIVEDGKGLSREQELLLVEDLNNNIPVFVIDWPKNIKPFYMRECLDNPNSVSAVDLLVPQVGELCGGSLRENDTDLLENKLREFDPSGKTLESLSWYIDLRKFGGVPSGGFGMGLDRLLLFVFGRSNIKDVVPFPRWAHSCQM